MKEGSVKENNLVMFEFEKLTKEGVIKEVRFMDNLLANSFKVSNGSVVAYIYFNKDNMEVYILNKDGEIKHSILNFD